eukprot:g10221.t1
MISLRAGVVVVVGLFVGGAFFPGAAQPDATGTLSLLERYPLPSAVCADGSPGFFYMAANASSNDFMIRLMGGGGCANNETYCQDIRDISAPLFTSDETLWPQSVAGFNALSGDEDANPLYSTFNRVFVPYCTLDMMLLDTESSDGGLQFRGRPYLEEVLTTVLGTSSQGATAVLVGTSAGGVAAFNVASWLLDTFDQVAELSLILDSAFFFDVHGSLNLALEYMQRDPSVAYDGTYCSEEFNGGPCCMQLGCMVQRGYYPSKDERLRGTLVVSPAQDVLPGFFVDTSESATAASDQEGEESASLTALWDAAAYAGQSTSLLRNVASLYPAEMSVFAPSCADHTLLVAASAELFMCFPEYEVPPEDEFYDEYSCAFEGASSFSSAATYVGTLGDVGLRVEGTTSAGAWESIKIDGTSIRDAMDLWWEGRGDPSKQVFLFDECDDLNCNPTCQTGLLPGTRGETESVAVRVVVIVTFVTALLTLAAGVAALTYGLLQGKRANVLVAVALENENNDGYDGYDGRDGYGDSVSLSGLSGGLLQKPARRTEGGGGAIGGHGGDGSKADVSVLEWKALSYWLPPSKGGLLRGGRRKRAAFVAGEDIGTASASPFAGASTPPRGRQLLHAMHGEVPRGALCALMGPSGSGKSTLLDLLTGRRSIGCCEGQVMFDGRSIADQQEAYISRSGYMRQGDAGYLDGLTVLENLVYAAMLRFPGTVEQQSRRVSTAVKQASLERSAHTRAGDLSGGQKRRLKIALELLVDRRILFLDEPSSGLDATASLELVTILKRLSEKVTIVVAIHQPRPEVWRLFDHAILLSGGRTVFCGPADEALAGTTRYLVDQIPAPACGHPKPKSGQLGASSENDDTSRPPLTAPSLPATPPSPAGPTAPATMPKPVPRTPTEPIPRDSESFRVPEQFLAAAEDGGVEKTTTAVGRDGKPDDDLPKCWAGSVAGEGAGGVESSTTAGGDQLQRIRQLFQMKQWESDRECCGASTHQPTKRAGGTPASPEALGCSSADHDRAINAGKGMASPSSGGLEQDPRRTIPDKLLDRLMMIANEASGKPQAEERKEAPGMFLEGEVRSESRKLSSRRVLPAETLREDAPTANEPGVTRTAPWKVAAALLARSCKGGYAREVASTSVVLAMALVLIGVSLLLADQSAEGLMFHLVLSVLTVSLLPVMLVYSPVMIVSMYAAWPLTKLEIADGFYPPWCATARYVIDHFAVGVVVSFVAVCIAHVIFWGDFISELPASALEVHATLSCVITLSAWVMISVFDVLVVSGLSLESVCGFGNAVTTVWGAFSGTVLLVSSVPAPIKAVTYSSPHYWATFFGLRVLLDGLDLTSSCDHTSSVYCASSYGDLVVHSLDFHIHTTGVAALSLAALAAAGLSTLAGMVHAKGRHVRIIGGLRQPADGFGPLSRSVRHDIKIGVVRGEEGGAGGQRTGDIDDRPPTLPVSRPPSTESQG